jgi:hypothetical protein
MPSVLSKLFRRPPGSGWLVLSGGSMPVDLSERALALVDRAGSIVAVVPTPDDLAPAQTALQDWTDLSGWSGRTVDCGSPDALEDALSEAGLVILPDLADSGAYARALGETDAGDFLLAVLGAGVVIVADGPAAEALGDQILSASQDPADASVDEPGLRWLPGAVVQTHFAENPAPAFTPRRKDLFRFGLPEGVAIAMGPAEEREIWGDGKPTITFREWWQP